MKLKIGRKEAHVTPFIDGQIKYLPWKGKFWRHTTCLFNRDVNVQRMITSMLKALSGCSSHHLQGVGAYWTGPTTGRTAC